MPWADGTCQVLQEVFLNAQIPWALEAPATIPGMFPGGTVHQLPMGAITNRGLKHVFILSQF